MGFSKKHQAEGGVESEGKKWVIAGIASRAPLKPISTKPTERECAEDGEEACSTTPTARESRIPEKLPCPPAPRKRRTSSSKCHYNGAATEFFIPPDLESVFRPRPGRAN